MDFSDALRELKAGKKVSRAGWNGKNMWIYRVPANSYPAQTEAAKDYWRKRQIEAGEGVSPVLVPYGAYYAMKTAQENVVPWLASQTDIDAEDWGVVD